MTTSLYAFAAICLYLAGAGWWALDAARADATPRPAIVALCTGALLLHALVLHAKIVTGAGLDLGFWNALALMSWAMALVAVAVSVLRPLGPIAVVLLPFAAFALGLEQLLPARRLLPDAIGPGLHMHILLSVGAWGLLALAALQTLALAVQERLLRAHRPLPAMHLPPLQVMERLLIQLLVLGFFLLSLSLATGFIFVRDVLAQHLAHKTVFSLSAWLLFGTVLTGHWLRGWRGRALVGWVLAGFGCLLLAYFGSKLVLELILQRV